MPPNDDQAFQAYLDDLQSGNLNYEEAKRRYLELGDLIKERYEKEITAVSVDVVDSRGAKGYGTSLEAQVTFDHYHRWVEDQLKKYGCRASDFTWAGDGLLAIFQDPDSAVSFAKALLEGLPEFNRRANRLRKQGLVYPLQLRIGAHTGPILQGAASGQIGRIASDTLDLAGHLQKSSAPNIVTISQTTRSKLREGAGQFVPIGSEMPNPTTCYAWPPDAAISVAASPPRAASVPAAPPAPQRGSWLPWVVAGGAVAALVMVVGVFNALLPQLTGRDGEGGVSVRTPRVVNPTPANAGVTPPAAAPAPGGTAPAVPPPTQNGGASTSAPSPRASGWEPSRQLWTSPDAGSGVPVRLVQSPPELRWLLAIGVGSYRDGSFSAPGAGESARAGAAAIQRSAAIPSGHVQVLTDGQATLENIKRGFLWLQQNASSGRDTVYLYLSGDVAGVPERPGMPDSGGSAYAFMPADALRDDPANSALYGVDIAAWLGATRAQTVVVFADTPYAGGMPYPGNTDQGRQYGLIAAAGAAQRAGSSRERTGGVFAESLSAGLAGAADLDRDRQVSLQELARYLGAEIPRRSGGAQTPEARPGFGGYLPEIVFAAGG